MFLFKISKIGGHPKRSAGVVHALRAPIGPFPFPAFTGFQPFRGEKFAPYLVDRLDVRSVAITLYCFIWR